MSLLLRLSFGLEEEARTIERAVDATLAAGLRTGDIAAEVARTVGARELGEAVAAQVAAM